MILLKVINIEILKMLLFLWLEAKKILHDGLPANTQPRRHEPPLLYNSPLERLVASNCKGIDCVNVFGGTAESGLFKAFRVRAGSSRKVVQFVADLFRVARKAAVLVCNTRATTIPCLVDGHLIEAYRGLIVLGDTACELR